MTAPWLDWMATLALWAMAISVASLLATLLLLPIVLARIPADYFRRSHRPAKPARRSLLAWLVLLGRNLLGGVLVAVGVLTLFTPGQGLITLLAGLLIAQFPGKYAIERWLIERAHVLETVNWIRARSDQAPLLPPDQRGDGA